MKEFTNDPTVAMQEVSDLFEKRLAILQNDLNFLKKEASTSSSSSSSSFLSYNNNISQVSKHRDLVIQSLNKILGEHIASFKKALKVHSDNVEQRKKRVIKYGQGLDLLKAGSSNISTTTITTSSNSSSLDNSSRNSNLGLSGYAMFSVKQNYESSDSIGIQSELRNRKFVNSTNPIDNNLNNHDNNNVMINNKQKMNDRDVKKYNNYSQLKKNDDRNNYNTTNNNHNYSQVQQMQEYKGNKQKDSNRLKNAEKVEASIMQMGQLFSKMATLVSEQSETLSRIEDDVESGLADTIDANESMNKLYEITKGNRGMILKIFALLIFFIFLFIVWT